MQTMFVIQNFLVTMLKKKIGKIIKKHTHNFLKSSISKMSFQHVLNMKK